MKTEAQMVNSLIGSHDRVERQLNKAINFARLYGGVDFGKMKSVWEQEVYTLREIRVGKDTFSYRKGVNICEGTMRKVYEMAAAEDNTAFRFRIKYVDEVLVNVTTENKSKNYNYRHICKGCNYYAYHGIGGPCADVHFVAKENECSQ